jgi:hypothetical protein
MSRSLPPVVVMVGAVADIAVDEFPVAGEPDPM